MASIMNNRTVFCQLSIAFILLVFMEPGAAQKLKLPKVGTSISGTEITEVGFAKGYFYIDLAYSNDLYYATTLSFDAQNPFYIKDRATGKQYSLLEPLPDASKPIKVCGRCTTTLRLTFQKIPESTRAIDLMQGKRSNGWNFYQIDLSEMYPQTLATQKLGTKFYGIIFNEELKKYGVCKLTVQKNGSVRMENHILKHLNYRDFAPFKFEYNFKRCGNQARYCDEEEPDTELNFSLRESTDEYNLDGDGFIRIEGTIRYKFFLLDKDKYKLDYDWYKGQLWVGEKLANSPNGYGALVSLQKQYSYYSEMANNGYPSQKESMKDYKDGYPYIRIGRFENGIFKAGSTHIYYSFNKHSYSVDGYNKIVAPIVDGAMHGGAILYRWAYDPYEEAFSNIFIGNVNGLFLADGEVKGYNFKNELAEQCQCTNGRLRCQRLKSTIEEKKFTELLGVTSIAVAEVGLLLKLADQISGPGSSSAYSGGTTQKSERNDSGTTQKTACFKEENSDAGSATVCKTSFPIKVVRCPDGEKQNYFFVENALSCGLIGGASKGYFKPSMYMGKHVGESFLDGDYNKAMKKLCKCD